MTDTFMTMDRSLQSMALALAITFAVPLMAGIAGTIITTIDSHIKEVKNEKRL